MEKDLINNVEEVLIEEEKGASMVEYALLVALIAIVAIVGLGQLGTQVATAFESIATVLQAVDGN